MPAGSKVLLCLGSANHDEREFEDADEFTPDRRRRGEEHLAFGWGIQRCVGAQLARLETRCALDAPMDAMAKMALAPGEVYERAGFVMVRGPRHLLVPPQMIVGQPFLSNQAFVNVVIGATLRSRMTAHR